MRNSIDFRWGSAPDATGGAYSAPPDPLAGFKGPTSKGRERRERDEEGTRREENGREMKGHPKASHPPQN